MDTFAAPAASHPSMAKRTITRTFISGVVITSIGVVLIPSAALAWVTHLDSFHLTVVQGWMADDYSKVMGYLIIAGALFALAGLVIGLAAWIGALTNSRELADKRWYQALLWCGLAEIFTGAVSAVGWLLGRVAAIGTGIVFGIGLFCGVNAMIAYLVAGPDAVGTGRANGSIYAHAVVWPKARIGKWFSWGLLPMAAGTVLALFVSFLTGQSRLLHGYTWTGLALITLFLVIAAYGAFAEIAVAWAALFNAHRLTDKTWFKGLLWSDIIAAVLMPAFGIGALLMLGEGIAFVISAPDGSQGQPLQA